MHPPHIPVLVQQIRLEATGVHSFDLVRDDGAPLPSFTAGAHIDVKIRNGLVRSYSIVNAPQQEGYYRIAVKLERDGRGGSQWFHEQLRVGQRIGISPPENTFPLTEDAPLSVLVAGGIGITPLLSMIGRLNALDRRWELHYSAKHPDAMPFRSEVLALAGRSANRLTLAYTANGDARLDIGRIVDEAPANAHVYCCGPDSMIDAFVAAAARRRSESIHFERFASRLAPATSGGFEIRLRSTGQRMFVPTGKSILDVLLEAGLDVPYSCTQGICGSCKLGLIDGAPDHRDECLGDDERAANRSIIVCCSGARSEYLVLDL